MDEEDMLPHIIMKGVNVKVNFGNDETKPFVYDIANHEAVYEDKYLDDFSDYKNFI
uniref:Spore coat protein n=1 Tax=Meloidogyne hapla TaxID=6305 RepID=A0A1I8BYY8_MELHA